MATAVSKVSANSTSTANSVSSVSSSAKMPANPAARSPPGPASPIWLVNAAFLQEIKDSNPHLWHEFHRLRTICQLEPGDRETPQQTIKAFVGCLDGLRDLIALQFALEESYGLISTPVSPSPYGQPSAEQIRLQRSIDERQLMIAHVIDQHRCLYLQLVDLVEQAEELQYRGCDTDCLQIFAEKVERFSGDFTAHERLEGELIRLHGSYSNTPANVPVNVPANANVHGDTNHVR